MNGQPLGDNAYVSGYSPHALHEESINFSDLVGRESEIAALDEILEPHIIRENCRPGVINIFGLPGIGKASLVEMWQQHLAQSRSAVITNLSQESIEQGYAQGASLCRQLEYCTSDYRADVVFLPIEDYFRDEGSRNPTFQSIETYMSALGVNNGRGRNRTVIVLTSTQELRLQKYLLMNLGKSPIRVGSLTIDDAIKMAGGDEERGALIHQITGGYAPAMVALNDLENSSLRAGTGENRQLNESQAIALRLEKVLTEQKIWNLLGDDPNTNLAAQQFRNPNLVMIRMLHLLTASIEPIHVPEIATTLELDQSSALAALDLIAGLIEWEKSSNGLRAGYSIQEPIKTILKNLYELYDELYVNLIIKCAKNSRRR